MPGPDPTKVDAIIVGATNGEAVTAIIEQAVAQGIPVIGLSPFRQHESSPPSSAPITTTWASLQAQCLAKALGGKGNVAMMAGPSGQAWADLRADGFRETLAKEAPDIKIIAESRLADNRNAALTTAEDWVQRFPDLNGVYAGDRRHGGRRYLGFQISRTA